MIMKIRQLENEIDSLDKEVHRSSMEIAQKLRREKEEQEEDEAMHMADVNDIENGNKICKDDLSKFLSTLKKYQAENS